MTDALTRYELRFAAIAGWLSAAVIAVNTLARTAVLPDSAPTQLLAPLAQVFAIGLVIGLYAACRRGRLLTVAFTANLAALAALVGVEFTVNLVLAHLETAQVDDLLAGPLGIGLTAASVLFVLATVLFAAAIWNRGLPRVPLTLYAIAVWPIGLRAFVPEIALQLGLAVLAVAVAWLALALWRRVEAA